MATIKIDRGTTFVIGFDYQKNGEPQSLVGSTVRFTVKTAEYDTSTDDSTALVTKDVTNGDANGHAEITLLPSDTSALTPGNLFYDIKVDEQSNGLLVYKVDEGKIKLDGSPTNRL